MIIRTVKNKENPYSQIPNKIINNPNLSYKAKGVLIYLISKPNNWETRISDIVKHGREGETAVSSAIKELEEAGYIIRKKIRGKDGKWAGWETLVFEEPQGVSPSQEAPLPSEPQSENHPQPKLDFPMSDNPISDNRPLINTDLSKTDLSKNIKYIATGRKPPGLDTDQSPPTNEDIKKLVSKFYKHLKKMGIKKDDKWFGKQLGLCKNLLKRYSAEEIEATIEWGFSDKFYRRIFVGLEKFDQILQAKKGGDGNGRAIEQYSAEYYDEPQYASLREKRAARGGT